MGFLSWLLMSTGRQANKASSRGSLSSIEVHMGKLMASADPHAFLIVTVAGTPDFIQFSGDSAGVQMDLPLITERQRGLGTAFRAACDKAGLSISRTAGSNGAQFLDVNISGSSREISQKVARILGQVFGLDERSALEFQTQ